MEEITLTGRRVRLRCLRESDADALVDAAADGELWNLPFTVVPSAETVSAYIRGALDGLEDGMIIPFVIELLPTRRIVGSTRFSDIDRNNRKLEIGSTWVAASWQRTFVNTETKFLMLCHAFEESECIRVQFITDEINLRTRAALLRIGAKEEGVIRNERIMPDGRKRNSILFSITDAEWPSVKEKLEARLPILTAGGCESARVVFPN